jgi:cytochrome c oxidase accessory protein FixG
MCPYARFQSAMFDKDTLIVTYDEERGEPRSGRSRKVNAKEKGLGDCIDCNFCVQVCPVGIDIRDGLQYECISCGLCIDACDSIMDKMEYPRGLIRFSTQNGMTQHWSKHEIVQKILRPRVLIYCAVLLALSIGLAVSLGLRSSFTVDVMRDNGVMSRLVPGGNVENVYRLQITNATEEDEIYRISVAGLKGLSVASKKEFKVVAASSRTFSVSLQILDGLTSSGSHKIKFEIDAINKPEHVSERSVFYMAK